MGDKRAAARHVHTHRPRNACMHAIFGLSLSVCLSRTDGRTFSCERQTDRRTDGRTGRMNGYLSVCFLRTQGSAYMCVPMCASIRTHVVSWRGGGGWCLHACLMCRCLHTCTHTQKHAMLGRMPPPCQTDRGMDMCLSFLRTHQINDYMHRVHACVGAHSSVPIGAGLYVGRGVHDQHDGCAWRSISCSSFLSRGTGGRHGKCSWSVGDGQLRRPQ